MGNCRSVNFSEDKLAIICHTVSVSLFVDTSITQHDWTASLCFVSFDTNHLSGDDITLNEKVVH